MLAEEAHPSLGSYPVNVGEKGADPDEIERAGEIDARQVWCGLYRTSVEGRSTKSYRGRVNIAHR